MLNETDIITNILLVDYVFKGDTTLSDDYKMGYVNSHQEEIMNTLPLNEMMELGDRVDSELRKRLLAEEKNKRKMTSAEKKIMSNIDYKVKVNKLY